MPIADAVVGVLDAEQAVVRLGGSGATEDKGAAAAIAALELALIQRLLSGAGAADVGAAGEHRRSAGVVTAAGAGR